MRPSIKKLIMRVEQRLVTCMEAVKLSSVASAYVGIYLHPGRDVVPVEDLVDGL